MSHAEWITTGINPKGKTPSLEPPIIEEVKQITPIPQKLDPLLLGTDCTTGEPITLEQEQRLSGLYLIGKTGTGKTTLLLNLILQDIRQGMGVCFFDTHGDAINALLARIPAQRMHDVILIDPLDKTHAFGLNLLECPDPNNKEEQSRVISSVTEIFAKLFTQSGDLLKEAPTMAETLQMTLPLLLARHTPPLTIAELPLLTRHACVQEQLLTANVHPMVQSFWRDEYQALNKKDQRELTASTIKRVHDFIIDPFLYEIIGQSRTTLNFRQIMDSGKILLVKLSREHKLISSLIGSVIVAQIANAAFSRADTPFERRVQFNLYADEYQLFCTPTFAELLAEVRKFKIATCVAHQWRSQLDPSNQGATLNAGSIIILQVTAEDAAELASLIAQKPPDPETRKEVREAISRHPLERLTQIIHPHEEIHAFTSDYLLSLVHYSQTLKEDELCENEDCTACATQLQEGKFLLDQLLVDVMTGRLLPSSPVLVEQISEIVLMLRGFLGIQTSAKVVPTYRLSHRWPQGNYKSEVTTHIPIDIQKHFIESVPLPTGEKEVKEFPPDDKVKEFITCCLNFLCHLKDASLVPYKQAIPLPLGKARKLESPPPHVHLAEVDIFGEEEYYLNIIKVKLQQALSEKDSIQQARAQLDKTADISYAEYQRLKQEVHDTLVANNWRYHQILESGGAEPVEGAYRLSQKIRFLLTDVNDLQEDGSYFELVAYAKGSAQFAQRYDLSLKKQRIEKLDLEIKKQDDQRGHYLFRLSQLKEQEEKLRKKETELEAFIEQKLKETIISVSLTENEYLALMQTYFSEMQVHPLCYTHLRTFVLSLLQVIHLLTLEEHIAPLKTQSGYEEKPGTTRTVMDMVNERALELTDLPAFCGWCKLPTDINGVRQVEKHKLVIRPIEKVENEAEVLAHATTLLLSRMHDPSSGLYQKRDIVRKEIEVRQAMFFTPKVNKTSRTTWDEEET
ncbi:type IV secretory system conjugative DNA transfer family protein [Dictyobacter formicarum]|uniref:AAA+ ATPase domain-containing protein n=1 Tax=Dictyobacter formicarum TaxID=2778368 RepID=A0ABQ3VGA3_9CHLR|nr:type IV secretion system DNA-binding domain-containing protein [Dictyobacter formicarum]GHO85190.1 hypothetical protein KSZ_31960 [Dictyobacter formicarum]